MTLRVRDLARLAATLGAEVVLLAGLWLAAPVLGSVDFAHPGAWLRDTDPTTAITAIARVAGIVFALWLLVTTVVYVVATVAGAEGLARRSGWVTLPVVRRMVDGVAAASILASTMGASGTGTATALAVWSRRAAVVQPVIPARPAAAEQHNGSTGAAVGAARGRVGSVGERAVSGRHLPHPGVLDHPVPASYSVSAGAAAAAAPSAANGFAGLAPGTKVVVVRPGDCLSVIAERALGDWRLDSEIHALNVGRTQPDGRSLTDDHWIYPGWVLVMPANAVGTDVVAGPAIPPAAAPPPAPAASSSTVTSPPPSPLPAAAGLHSGHDSTHPAAAVVPRAHPPASPARPETGPAPSATAAGPASASPSVGREPVGPRPPRGGATRDKPPSAAPQPVGHGRREGSGSVIPLPVELLGGGIMAAGFVALLTKLIGVQQGRRRRGRSICRPSGAQARVELAARIGADHNAAELVDVGCRYLAVQLRGRSAPLPVVVGVEVYPERLELLLDAPAGAPPDGFEMGEDASTWVWRAPENLEGLAGEMADVVPPLPELVSLGRTDTGITVMVNLGAVGVVGLGGDRSVAAEVVASAAVELATARWAQHCRVILVGFGHHDGLGIAEPVELVDRLGDCLPRLRAAAAELRALTGEQGFSTVEQLRLGGDPTDADPTIVICIDPPDEQAMTDLTDLASDPFSGLGAVVVTGPLEPTRVWQLAVTADGLLEVSPLARIVHAQRLPLPLLDAMEQRLQVARSTADVDTIPIEDWWPTQADQNLDGQTDDPDPGDTQPDDETDLLDDADPPDDTTPTDDDAEPPDDPVPPPPVGGHADPAPVRGLDPELEPGDRASENAPGNDGNGAAKGDGGAVVAGRSLRMVDSADRAQIPVLPAEGCPDGPPDILVQALRATPRVLRLAGPNPGVITVGRARSLEAIVCLAFHPEGVSNARLAEALHPERMAAGRTHNTDTFANELSGARGSLGRDADGNDYLPRKSGDRFRLAPSVALDWTIMERLLGAAEAADSDAERIRLLAAASALVGDDTPFADIRRQHGTQRRRPTAPQHWRWMEVEFLPDVEQTVIDVAGGLAELLFRADNIKEASRVARKGLKVSPLNRDLWRIYLSVEAERGHHYLQAARDDMAQIFEAEAEPYDTIDSELLHHGAHPQQRSSG